MLNTQCLANEKAYRQSAMVTSFLQNFFYHGQNGSKQFFKLVGEFVGERN